MKVIYGISRWTNPNRASARHIPNERMQPLCWSKRKVFTWAYEEGTPTCKKCIAMNKRGKSNIIE